MKHDLYKQKNCFLNIKLSPLISPECKNWFLLTSNYLHLDYQGVRTGACTLDNIACKVATTVISHKPNVGNIMVDCGWTAIGQDGLWLDKTEAPLGCCPVIDHPELRSDHLYL